MKKKELVEQIKSNEWNVLDQYKGKSLEELKEIAELSSLGYAVCALNLTGDLNVGMLMRSASLLGAEKFIIYGSKNFDKRTTVGAQNYIDVVRVDAKLNQHDTEIDYDNLIPTIKSLGYDPVFIENTDDAYVLHEPYVPSWLTRYDYRKPCLIVGNEGVGIPREIMQGHVVLKIKQYGVLRSLNAAVAGSIAMYEFSQWAWNFEHDKG